MYIQDNAAEFAGTKDSTVAVVKQQSQKLLSETYWPEENIQNKP